MKTTTKTLSFSLIAGLLLASPILMADNLGDRYDTYYLNEEIHTAPAGPVDSLGDRFAGFLLYDDIVVTESCADPVATMLGERFAGLVTPDEIAMAEQNKRC